MAFACRRFARRVFVGMVSVCAVSFCATVADIPRIRLAVGNWVRDDFGVRMMSVDLAMQDRGDLADFVGQLGKFRGNDGLHAVGESFVGLVMHFD
jgi:hypothetical protein